MLLPSSFSLLPCGKEYFLAISARGHFCFPPFDPLVDDDPVSLDAFFCRVAPDEGEYHFSRTYKLVEKNDTSNILALASICNSVFCFDSYEAKPESLRGIGFNEDFPGIMLLAFGVRHDCQKQGLGTVASNKLVELIRESSIAGVRVLTLHPLESAISFYKSLGCVEVYADDFEDDVESMFLDIWQND